MAEKEAAVAERHTTDARWATLVTELAAEADALDVVGGGGGIVGANVEAARSAAGKGGVGVAVGGASSAVVGFGSLDATGGPSSPSSARY